MIENKYNVGDLRQRQSLPLQSKILLAKKRIWELSQSMRDKTGEEIIKEVIE